MAEYVDEKQQRWEQAAKLAMDIIDECRVQLMLKFRFLDFALWRMDAEPITVQGRYPLATDAKTVYYEPYAVLSRFDDGFEEEVRDYLHLVLHCIFRHPYDSNHDRHDAWWLACDIVVESVAMEMCGSRFESELDPDRRAALSDLRMICGQLTPAKLYSLFVRSQTAPENTDYQLISQSKVTEYRALFERDNHEAWPAFAKTQTEQEPGEIQELGTPDDDAPESGSDSDDREMIVDGETSEADGDEQLTENSDSSDSNDSDDKQAEGSQADADDISDKADTGDETGISSEQQASSTDEETDQQVEDEKSQDERDWEEIAKQIEMNLETFSKEWGDEAGSLMASLAVANRKRYDYSDFLRRFTMLSEEMKINDDEYDYIFYTYGLELYGDMPLVEPLEYKETQRIRDFVICIDTSESVKGDLVRKFVEHTFSVMKKAEDFAHEVNVHIIQCDAKVQADTKITDLREVDSFMEGFFIRGMGGTDFRPAFAYVNSLRDSGELPDMKGLIYFTDGLGQFPEAAPDYDAAFVFMDEGDAYVPAVPPWAMRIVIDEEGINRLKSGL